MRLGIEVTRSGKYYQLWMTYTDGGKCYICDSTVPAGDGWTDTDSLLQRVRLKVGFDKDAAGLINPKGAINRLALMLHGINRIEIINHEQGNNLPLD